MIVIPFTSRHIHHFQFLCYDYNANYHHNLFTIHQNMFNQLKSMAGVDSLEEMVSVASYLLIEFYHSALFIPMYHILLIRVA